MPKAFFAVVVTQPIPPNKQPTLQNLFEKAETCFELA